MNEELLKRLDVFAAKLGVTAQHLWGVLAKQAQVEMWKDATLVGVWVAFAFTAALLAKRCFDKGKEDYCGEWEISCATLCALAFAFVLAAAYCAQWAVTECINPEYWALDKLLSSIK